MVRRIRSAAGGPCPAARRFRPFPRRLLAPELLWLAGLAGASALVACNGAFHKDTRSHENNARSQPVARSEPAAQPAPRQDYEAASRQNSRELFDEGQKIFRDDTFGSEAFWGDKLQLHRALAGKEKGGIGEGVSARTALQDLGLKVDMTRVPAAAAEALRQGTLDLDSPDTTLALLQANAVVGLKAFFDRSQRITSLGITCALCHSTVDDAMAPGIGRRLDGWPNRDLNVGAIVASAPDLKAFTDMLRVDEPTLKKVLMGWGPGRYDAELVQDGKAARPDGKTAATLLPAAFGLAGQNLHTYSGWGSVPYWNAYVANTQMHGKGTFVDRRLSSEEKFPVAARTGAFNKRDKPDLITSKLPALQFYQLALPAPKPPEGSYDKAAAARGEGVFMTEARCAECHVPPLFSEPGWPMHTPEEIGIDDFQSERSPDRMYRTTPLRGLFTRAKGGFYHDGRFADLPAVVRHYEGVLKLSLTEQERRDLIEYLKSL